MPKKQTQKIISSKPRYEEDEKVEKKNKNRQNFIHNKRGWLLEEPKKG